MTAVTLTHTPKLSTNRSARAWILRAFEAHRERRALARLDASQLKDIGLHAHEMHRETLRPIWDLPMHLSR